MVQELTTLPSAGTRFAQGVQQGMSNVLPKEFEHQRLKSGLQALAQKSKAGNLSPEEFLAEAAGTYGISPQAVQSFGKLASQQAQARSLSPGESVKEPKNNPFKTEERPASAKPSQVPSVTRADILERVQKGFVEPDINEVQARAGKRYTENPALYGYDPDKAIAAEEANVAKQRKAYEDEVELDKKLQTIHDNTVNRLREHTNNLQTKIPENLYKTYENEAINAVIPKSMGGGGLTEDQATDEIGKKIDQASREYSNLKALGGWELLTKPAAETQRNIENLRKEFEKRDDTRNMADSLVADVGLSYPMAYAQAQPVHKNKELNSKIKSIPTLEKTEHLFTTDIPNQKEKTLKVSEDLAQIFKKNKDISPLAVAYELDKKNYDMGEFLQYLTDHQDELNLGVQQVEQLTKSFNTLNPPMADWWLQSWSGIK